MENNKSYAQWGVVALAILATVIYYPTIEINEERPVPVIKQAAFGLLESAPEMMTLDLTKKPVPVFVMDTIPDDEPRIRVYMDGEEVHDFEMDDHLVELENLEGLDLVMDLDFDFDSFDQSISVTPPTLDLDINVPMNFQLDTLIEPDMLRELEKAARAHELYEREFEMAMRKMEEFNERYAEEMETLHENLIEKFDDEDFENLSREFQMNMEKFQSEEWNEQFEHSMRELQEKMAELSEWQAEVDWDKLAVESEKLRQFEARVQEMLIYDGYIEAGDQVKIEFEEDDIKINGNSVKEKDLDKYLELREEFFPNDDGKFSYWFN